jgi:Holliday junction DNA helicase RuvB
MDDFEGRNKNRPSSLDGFISNNDIKNTIRFTIAAIKESGKEFPNTLITGNPGTGKTTLAMIIAKELEVKIRICMGPSVKDAMAISNLFIDDPDGIDCMRDGDIVFIDEIHAIKKAWQEMLYTAMEDRYIPVTLGDHTFNYPIKKIVIIMATNESSNLPGPLVDRCDVKISLNQYDNEEIRDIIMVNADILNVGESHKVTIGKEVALVLANVCRGIPRIGISTYKNIRNYALATGKAEITMDVLRFGLGSLGVDEYGLTKMDRQILKRLFGVRAMSKDTLASILGMNPDILVRDHEPYLLIQGLIMRTGQGRAITPKGWKLIADGCIQG